MTIYIKIGEDRAYLENGRLWKSSNKPMERFLNQTKRRLLPGPESDWPERDWAENIAEELGGEIVRISGGEPQEVEDPNGKVIY